MAASQSPRQRRGVPRVVRDLLLVLAALGVGLGGVVLYSSRHASPREQPSVQRLQLPGGPPASIPPTVLPVQDPAVAGKPVSAIQAFFKAQARQDFAASYAMLDAASKAAFPDLGAWEAVQPDRPRPVQWRITAQHPRAAGVVDLDLLIAHRPGLDPVTGLTPGHTAEVWRVSRTGSSWLVHGTAISSKPLYPGDNLAPAAVEAWVARLLACDERGAATLQTQPYLYGAADPPTAPCRERGRWTVGAVQPFDAVADQAAYLAAFGPTTAGWARGVPVRGPNTRFVAVLAPFGDAWRVVGTSTDQPTG